MRAFHNQLSVAIDVDRCRSAAYLVIVFLRTRKTETFYNSALQTHKNEKRAMLCAIVRCVCTSYAAQ